jgi:hypothetical protein
MYHLVAYTNGLLGTAVDTDIAAITDNIMYIQNNHIVPQNPVQVYAAYAISPTLLRAQISTPKTRQINKVYVRQIDFGATLPSANPNMDIKKFSPLTLNQLEEIQILATAAPATTERFLALLWLMINFEPIPLGDVYTFRWTSTVPAVAYTWTGIGVPLFEQIPPLGIYTVIDSEEYSTNAIGHRLVFDVQYWRPGNLSFANNRSRVPYYAQYGMFGNMGRFSNTNLPRVELMNGSTDASHEGYLHAVKTG